MNKMKSVLIIGMGRFGRHAAMKLNELGHQVMCIDKDEESVNAVLPYATGAQIGDGTDEDFLMTLGVRNFDVCIVAIGDDFQASLETTSLLKDLGASFVVARASRDVHAKFLLRNGADKVVYPEKQLANWTAIRYSSDHIFDYIELEGDYAIFEVDVPRAWWGKTVGELNIRRHHGINIMAFKGSSGMNMNIDSESVFDPQCTMLVLGKYKDIQKCFKL